MAQEENKYLGESGLRKLIEIIKAGFAKITHSHTLSEITDYTVDSEIKSNSENPVQNKVVKEALDSKVPIERTVNGKSLDADINLNASDVGTMTSDEITSGLDAKANATEVAYIDIEDNENIEYTEIPTSGIIVDSVLSETSTNPVQNKVITNELGKLSKYIDAIEEVGSYTLTWDGDTSGLTVLEEVYYKVGSVVPTREDLLNGLSITFVESENESTTVALAGEELQEIVGQDGFALLDIVVIIPYDNYDLGGGLFADKGVYFMNNGGLFCLSFTVNGYTGFATPKIKEEYIPDRFKFGVDYSDETVLVDNVTVEVVEGGCLVSEGTLLGFGYTYKVIFDGIDYIVEAKKLPDDSGIYAGNLEGFVEDTGEPFTLLAPIDGTTILLSDDGTYTLSIIKYGNRKIPQNALDIRSRVYYSMDINDPYLYKDMYCTTKLTGAELTEMITKGAVEVSYGDMKIWHPIEIMGISEYWNATYGYVIINVDTSSDPTTVTPTYFKLKTAEYTAE